MRNDTKRKPLLPPVYEAGGNSGLVRLLLPVYALRFVEHDTVMK
ncbi:hypothetical protein E9230_002178 [Corynebacterium glutamicum]|nr:hypothetical protein [Corynebacterium glutamicum]